MPALKARRSDRVGAAHRRARKAAPAANKARAARVLRKPRRWRISRRLAARALALAVVLGAAVAWQSGGAQRAVAALKAGAVEATVDAGMAVDEVFIEGRRHAPMEGLRKSLGIARGDAILTIDLAAARARIEANPWVAAARIERRLPDRLHIRIVERRPVALWQHRGEVAVVDRAGRVLTRSGVAAYAALPLVVGSGAPAALPALAAAMAEAPELRRRLSAASWIADRRWTLRFDDRTDVLLPEGPPERAWRRLAALQRRAAILDADVTRVDLRDPGRVLVRLAGAADPESPT